MRADVDSDAWQAWRDRAVATLRYPAVRLSGVQAHAIGVGFGNAVHRSGFTVWACSILPQHVHLVIARHRYRIERVSIQLKGEATKRLHSESRHPFAKYAQDGNLPSL